MVEESISRYHVLGKGAAAHIRVYLPIRKPCFSQPLVEVGSRVRNRQFAPSQAIQGMRKQEALREESLHPLGHSLVMDLPRKVAELLMYTLTDAHRVSEVGPSIQLDFH